MFPLSVRMLLTAALVAALALQAPMTTTSRGAGGPLAGPAKKHKHKHRHKPRHRCKLDLQPGDQVTVEAESPAHRIIDFDDGILACDRRSGAIVPLFAAGGSPRGGVTYAVRGTAVLVEPRAAWVLRREPGADSTAAPVDTVEIANLVTGAERAVAAVPAGGDPPQGTQASGLVIAANGGVAWVTTALNGRSAVVAWAGDQAVVLDPGPISPGTLAAVGPDAVSWSGPAGPRSASISSAPV